MPVPRVRVVAALSGFALAAAGAAIVPTAADAVDLNSGVVLSEVYGGGGNSGAQYANDFLELYNHGTTDVSVAGWSVQYTSATGTSWQSTPLTGTVPAGGYYLVKEGAGSGTGAPLPTPNDTGTIALSAANGKVALVNNSTALTGCAAACSSAAGVVDFLGFGTANDAAGTATPALSNTTSAQRTTSPFSNTGNNASDFVAAAPTPAGAVPPRRRRPPVVAPPRRHRNAFLAAPPSRTSRATASSPRSGAPRSARSPASSPPSARRAPRVSGCKRPPLT